MMLMLIWYTVHTVCTVNTSRKPSDAVFVWRCLFCVRLRRNGREFRMHGHGLVRFALAIVLCILGCWLVCLVSFKHTNIMDV